MVVKSSQRLIAVLMGAAAPLMIGNSLSAQTIESCVETVTPQPGSCLDGNATTVVNMPVGENNRVQSGVPAPKGFSILVDGDPIAIDEKFADRIRKTDVALAAADIQVRYDGLDVNPRLDLEKTGGSRRYVAGETVTLQSATNYPGWLSRGEVKIVDIGARGGPRTVAVVPIQPNGQVSFALPEGKNLVAIHRVYDSTGRFDETHPIPLTESDGPDSFDGVEEGRDSTARRTIPVSGGAVTVNGSSVAPGAVVRTLGEVVSPDSDGSFVIQRILPTGVQAVSVQVQGGGPDLQIVRDIEIPKSDWFITGTVDATFGWREGGTSGERETYQKGRIAIYAKGKTASGYSITASVDTGEEALEDLFRNLDQKDPRKLLQRIDPDEYYLVYGDDSTFEETAPTSGKFYVKVEKAGNHVLWGNFKASLNGAEYIRNERTLYGAQAVWASQERTQEGEARYSASAYAAQPENLPGRDSFRGTGGSVYFLQRNDLSLGSETITLEVRDRDTGRVIDRQTLVYGRDYDINYVQGIVTLASPLSGGGLGDGIVSTGQDDVDVNLVVQYEWTPTASDFDGFSYGGRAEAWLTDNIRLGVSGLAEKTDISDQTANGVDLLWQGGENTWVELEYARSNGVGFGSSYSTDGGLLINQNAGASGKGEAIRFEARAELSDLGMTADGHAGVFYEDRTEGFSTLDFNIEADETIWGFFAEVSPSQALTWKLNYKDYSNADGRSIRESAFEMDYAASETIQYAFGVSHTDRTDSSQDGTRTDLSARITYKPQEALEWFTYGKATIAKNGLDSDNRLGVGAKYQFSKNWNVQGDVSGGTTGWAGRALLGYDDRAGTSNYFGYEVTPGREFAGENLVGRDLGRFVFGGKRKVNDRVSSFHETSYDLFGEHRTLTTAYGVDYKPHESVVYSTALEFGEVVDPADGNFNRQAVSFGVRYKDDAGLSVRGRAEFRRENGVLGGTSRDADTLLIAATARVERDPSTRFLFSFDGSWTDTDQSTILDGTLVDASIGYAYRPVTNDKLNVLLKYRYLHDMYGQRIDGSDESGPVQNSHVFTVDGNYDLNRHWTIGAKVGYRKSQSAPDESVALTGNDAWLGILNARYHLVHNWDALIEARALGLDAAGTTEYGAVAAIYRHVGNNLKVGVGYNAGRFSDDLTDMTFDDRGMFLNLVAKF